MAIDNDLLTSINSLKDDINNLNYTKAELDSETESKARDLAKELTFYHKAVERIIDDHGSRNAQYNINVPEARKFVQDNKSKYLTKDFPLSKLSNVNVEDAFNKSYTEEPILVVKAGDGSMVVGDGLHRLRKAIKEDNIDHLDVYLVPKEDLKHLKGPIEYHVSALAKIKKSNGGGKEGLQAIKDNSHETLSGLEVSLETYKQGRDKLAFLFKVVGRAILCLDQLVNDDRDSVWNESNTVSDTPPFHSQTRKN